MDERRGIKESLPVRILSKFKSVKLAAWVIALLTMIYFLGLVIPQKWMFDTGEQYAAWMDKGLFNKALDFIGFTDIYLASTNVWMAGRGLAERHAHRSPDGEPAVVRESDGCGRQRCHRGGEGYYFLDFIWGS